MRELVNILLPYLMGILCSYWIFEPMRNWNDGYATAKKLYSNWWEGFDTGYEHARKFFTDYDRGFGDGFESGWNASMEQVDEGE